MDHFPSWILIQGPLWIRIKSGSAALPETGKDKKTCPLVKDDNSVLSLIDTELILFSSDVQVYYSTNPQQPLSQWESQFVDNNKLTTISDLTPHTIYTIRVEAYTSIGPGPLSNPVQVLSKLVFFYIYHLNCHIFTILKARWLLRSFTRHFCIRKGV